MDSSRVQVLENDVMGLIEQAQNCPQYKVSVFSERIGSLLEQLETECAVAPYDVQQPLKARIGHYREQQQQLNLIAGTGGVYRSIQTAEDSERIAGEVGRELRGQTEQLLRTRERLDDTNVDLSRVSRLLTVIRLNIVSNRILLVFLIIIEIAILLALCFIKFIH